MDQWRNVVGALFVTVFRAVANRIGWVGPQVAVSIRIPAGYRPSGLTLTVGVRAAGAGGGSRPAPRTANRSNPSL
jgi:hypothetical protein